MVTRLTKAFRILFFRDNRVNHELSKWEIEKGQLLGRIKKLENKLLDKRMETMENLLNMKNSQNNDVEMVKLLMSMFKGGETTATVTPESKPVNLNISEVQAMLKQYPKLKEMGKNLTPEELRTQVINHIPTISKESLTLIEQEVHK